MLIVISHDRHFLNSVCTHIADIDYETIITYTGTYDDMVVAKTQIRSQIESQNAQREKKISQLNEFIARFSGRHALQPGAVAPQRSRAVAGHGTGEFEHSTAIHKFDQKRPSGKHILEIESCDEGLRRRRSGPQLHRQRYSWRKDRAHGTQRRR